MQRLQAAVSFGLYGADILLSFFPWIVIGDDQYNLFQLALVMKDNGLEEMIAGVKTYADMENLAAVKAGILIELVFFGAFFLCSIFYLAAVLSGKGRKLNIAAFGTSFAAYYLHMTMSGYAIWDITTDRTLGGVFPGMMTLLSGLELMTVKIMGIWKETKRLSEESRKKDLREKKEKQERLRFYGRYSELFYRFVWKNFKGNWKDYILLLLCSILVFTFIVTGFGLNRILGAKSRYEGMDQILGGLNGVLINTVIPLGIISVIIIVILTFYYLRCRAKNYGIFFTLGMRKMTLQYFVVVEFFALILLTFVVGGILGTGILCLFSAKSEMLMGEHTGLSVLGAGTYFSAAAGLLLIYLTAFMAARDIFYDFNMGRGTDLNAVREEMPKRRQTGFLVLGLSFCLISILRYRRLKNFESAYLLLLFFAGIYITLRCGIARWLEGERKNAGYLGRLMVHNQLFHKSKTNTRYIFAMAVIQFCALFYFSSQMISVMIAEDGDMLYPYDIVCMANDEDEDIFQRMEKKEKITRREYPMIRVSNYDSTEKPEGALDVKPPQGQHIGISESTYHELKAQLDADYQRTDLHLDAEGKRIYIVHQQDKSVKAQPIDFFMSRAHPLLHAGTPCINASAVGGNIEENGYYFKDIAGEEIGSLTGAFRQGLKDNLVVFSDEYFEQAKELWKTTDMTSGRQLSEDTEKIPGVDIRQGPSRLVLIHTEEKDISGLESELAEFKERHREDEKYDLTVPCYYTKQEAIRRLRTERVMKITMNLSLLSVSLFVYLVLLSVKMATEADMVIKRAVFLNCMGMRQKERRGLIRKELLCYYYLLPVTVAAGSAAVYTAAVFYARQYTGEDILAYLRLMALVWAVSLAVTGAAAFVMTEMYVQKAERRKEW